WTLLEALLMDRRFNLVDEPWIPVVYADGSSTRVGWRGLLGDSARIVDIPTDPTHLYGMVIRFATAIFLRTQGAPLVSPRPADWQAWGASRLDAGIDGSTLDAYFEQWGDRFWLIDRTHPFLQDPTIATECTKPASTNKLFFEVASGNNHLWWTKTPDKSADEVPFDIAAMALLGQWGYAAGGRCTARAGIADSKQAPERAFSQFIPRGQTLFETLLMCCTPAVLDASLAEKDVPVWEADPGAVLVPGQLGRLTASTRGLLAFSEGDGVTGAINTWSRGEVGDEFWTSDVFMAKKLVGREKEIAPLKFGPSSAIWRNAPAILANNPDAGAQMSPMVLDPARNPLGATEVFFRSGVSVVSHFADKSKDLGWGRSELPEVLAAGPSRDAEAFERLGQFCLLAGEVLNKVAFVVVSKRGPKAGRQVPVITDGEMFVGDLQHDAESVFYAVLHGMAWEDGARQLLDVCLERFDAATERVGAPEQLAATIQRRRQLGWQLRKITEQFGLNNTSEVVA
ncbi:MAG: type I-E CRISPR-associated protein Cse1/CasA, partial [Verrucomicrobiales bacterium]